jgi:hypothetical protein
MSFHLCVQVWSGISLNAGVLNLRCNRPCANEYRFECINRKFELNSEPTFLLHMCVCVCVCVYSSICVSIISVPYFIFVVKC